MQSLPRIEDSLDCLDGATIITSLDLRSRYWQVELTEASRPSDNHSCRTFRVIWMCPDAFWFNQCPSHTSMPDGVMPRRYTPQMVYNLFGWHHCLFQNIRGAYSRLRSVFEKFSAAGLQLKLSKCEFFKSWIAYLGHIVSKDGIDTDPKKITTIKGVTGSKNGNRSAKFLGFTSYYCKFIPKYAHIAWPINHLVLGENVTRKKLW